MSTNDPEPKGNPADEQATKPVSEAPGDEAAAQQPPLAPPAPVPPFAQAPPAPVPPFAQPPFAQPPFAQPPYGPGFAGYGMPGYDPAFAPVYRAPRSPWIAPQRKGSVAIIAIVVGVLLFGVGALTGGAIARHHDNRVVFQRDGFARVYPQPGGRNVNPLPARPTDRRRPAPAPSTTS